MFASTNQSQSAYTLSGIQNPIVASVTMELYDQYRRLAMSMVNIYNAELVYKVVSNDSILGAVGYGIHESLIYYGRNIIDLSVGEPHYPWVAADADPRNAVTVQRLQQIANRETNPLIAGRIRAIANFTAGMPAYTKIYYYHSMDNSVKAVTVEDEMNMVKLNVLVSHDVV